MKKCSSFLAENSSPLRLPLRHILIFPSRFPLTVPIATLLKIVDKIFSPDLGVGGAVGELEVVDEPGGGGRLEDGAVEQPLGDRPPDRENSIRLCIYLNMSSGEYLLSLYIRLNGVYVCE